jgi:bifunctional non-homologous end joining protein LigD
MNPAEKRLAIRTEDHPLDYATFEGVISKGQYGAGTVMVWDLGKYAPLDDHSPEEQLVRGNIDIVVLGEKLRGGFTLVRIDNQSTSSSRRENWLLIKHRDEHADPSWRIESPWLDRSVLTGRTLEEIKDGKSTKPGSGRRV